MSGKKNALDIAQVEDCLEREDPIRLDLGGRGRLYMDRPMPFIAVCIGRQAQPAAREAVTANAAYLLVQNATDAIAVLSVVGAAMQKRFGGFLVIDIGEMAEDRLAADAPYLAPFAINISNTPDPAAQAAAGSFASAMQKVDGRYRMPRIERLAAAEDRAAGLARRMTRFGVLTIRFAPIYKAPQSKNIYPELRDRLAANIVDATLRGAAEFAHAETGIALTSHRALGRRVFIDAVGRADRAIDDIAGSFDFLLAVTPINAEAAWAEFSAASFERAPHFLYRPLTFEVAATKKALFAIGLDHFEDPVLSRLYREKQQELDLQLSMLSLRDARQFKELGRALYQSVEPRLTEVANDILAATARKAGRNETENVDYRFVEKRAQAMIERYSAEASGFVVKIDIRDDLPAGLMVSNGSLLISRNTKMARDRVEALLSHEVGVHLLTYFNGSGHGLRLFRSGLAGYEGAQEGLAVLAEFLAGGMTVARLRLLAGRVLAVAAMLEGASFVETFRLLSKEHGFSDTSAFSVSLRVYRGGGLAKDAIYLRGLLEILAHLKSGGSLEPFWLGKIAAGHFSIMQELSTRGLLKPARLEPQFLSMKGAEARLDRLRAGLTPIDLIQA
ncbi:flavohemoglobin expression-modulating QEGLA motif protein [Devosia riboflavina]